MMVWEAFCLNQLLVLYRFCRFVFYRLRLIVFISYFGDDVSLSLCNVFCRFTFSLVYVKVGDVVPGVQPSGWLCLTWFLSSEKPMRADKLNP